MKIIDNILDDYFCKALVKDILYNINIRFNLDTKIEYEKSSMGKQYTRVKILVKPRHYKVYTEIFYFVKGDSLNHLTSLKCAEKDYITEKIRTISRENLWNRN